MDFFQAQAEARNRSRRLVPFLALALFGTAATGYLVAVFPFVLLYRHHGDIDTVRLSEWWQPRLFLAITTATLLFVCFAAWQRWRFLRDGGGAVADSVDARRIDLQTPTPPERRLLNIVEEMAIAAGLPVPAVYVLDDEPCINAFAAGLTPDDAVVVVTNGALEKLNREEL